MGMMQRRKGARGELSLCLHLNLIGYDARRVIRTRAVKGYEKDVVPDVIATRNEIEYTFECKFSANRFKSVYALFEKEAPGGSLAFTLSSEGPYVAMSTDFEKIRGASSHHFLFLEPTKTVQKIVRLQKLLKGAQYLAIKQNNKPFLFLRFWS